MFKKLIEVEFAKGFAVTYRAQIFTTVFTKPIIRLYSEPV